MKDYKEAMQQGREFIAANLAQCCKEELEWQNTALLCDGKLREAAAIFNTVDSTHCMPIAQSEVARQAMALAASGGNAAPPDACPVAITDSSAPNGIKWYVIPPDHLKNGMNLYFVPAKIVPASAPNAALVAALGELIDVAERCDSWESFPSNALDKARAALSAAGQEVDHG